jgi:hypothetical protein
MRPGRWNLEEFPTGTQGHRNISRPDSFFDLFPLKALLGTIIFTKIVISRQNTSGLRIYSIILVLKNFERCDRGGGTYKNSRPVPRDIEIFPDRRVFPSYFLIKLY